MSTTTPPRTIEVQDFAGNILARVPHDWTDQQIKDEVQKPKLNTKIVSRDADQVMVGFVEPFFKGPYQITDGYIGCCGYCSSRVTDKAWTVSRIFSQINVCQECKTNTEWCFRQDLPKLKHIQELDRCDLCFDEHDKYYFFIREVGWILGVCKPCYDKYKPRIA